MATAYQLPTAATPIERILSRFDRKQIEDFVEIAISLLDVANDPDLEEDDPSEANGDEQDACGSYEEDMVHGDDGQAGDPTDTEEDDPSGQCDEDGVNTTPFAGYWVHGRNHDGPGCPISDPGEWPVPLTLNPDADSWLK